METAGHILHRKASAMHTTTGRDHGKRRHVGDRGAETRRGLCTVGIITLALFTLSGPLAAKAQQVGKVPRVGILTPASVASTPLWEAFQQGLHELGYVEGKNMVLEYRLAAGNERLPELAAELVRLKVDLIVTDGTLAARVAKDATGTIPIVMASSGAPIEAGVVASLARPGGNVTGLSVMAPELGGKRLEILKEILPHVSRVAVLWTAGNLTQPSELREIEATARVLRIQLHPPASTQSRRVGRRLCHDDRGGG
jgi:putative ABC transport system substrate-binding protein